MTYLFGWSELSYRVGSQSTLHDPESEKTLAESLTEPLVEPQEETKNAELHLTIISTTC